MVISWLSGYPRLLEGYQANATWLSIASAKGYPCWKYIGYHGYQVILDCWKVIRPINATWLSIASAKVIHARSIRLSWLSGYPRLLEGYQANATWLSSLAKVIHA